MKTRTKIVIVALLIVLILAAVIGLLKWREQKEMEQIQQETLHREKTYENLNLTFHIYGETKEYLPYDEEADSLIFIDLACYQKETGKVLSLEEVMEYYSEEFEDDGSLRLYNNGKHSQIEEYVNWALENTKTRNIYRDNIVTVYATYLDEKEIPRGERTPFSELTLDQLQELINKEVDPNYEINI